MNAITREVRTQPARNYMNAALELITNARFDYTNYHFTSAIHELQIARSHINEAIEQIEWELGHEVEEV